MGKSKKRKHKKLKQEYRRDCNVCNSTWFYSGEDIGNEDYKEKMEYYQKISTLGSMLIGKLAPSAFLQTEDRVDLQRCQECGSRDTIITKISSPIETKALNLLGMKTKTQKVEIQRSKKQKIENEKLKKKTIQSRIGKVINNEKQSSKIQKVENIKSEDQRTEELKARDIEISEAIEDIESFIKGVFQY